jgi:type 1 glutamine amidotransferase
MKKTTLLTLLLALPLALAAADRVVYEGASGPGKGRHIVLVSGDEEYRSEEGLTQLARILAQHHGFKCTVLFALDPASGFITPTIVTNLPGLEALKTADLMIISTRFRNLPDDQMKPFVDYVEAGKPVIGLRTATHSFNIPKGATYAKYSWNNPGPDYAGGFGRQVLGETWINHWGKHGVESTRGLIAPDAAKHPIVRGIADGDITCPTDVYEVRLPLPGDSQPLIMGQVLTGMKPTDPPVEGKKNSPMMPVAWTKTYKGGRVFTTTMGAAVDLNNEALRRLLVNAAYWCVGLEKEIPAKSNVDLVGEWKPSYFGFGAFVKGVKPEDLKLK